MEEEKIFHLIEKEKNDKISKFRLTDRIELLSLLEDYKITYRPQLGLPKEVTIGLEIECEHANRKEMEKELKKYPDWIVKEDESLTETNGIEINSPVLNDTKKNWKEVKDVCKIINKNAMIDINSAGHIHIGSNILQYNKTYVRNLLKLWAAYENVLFRFGYGEYQNERPNIKNFAEPIAEFLVYSNIFEECTNDCIDGTIWMLTKDRHNALNLQNARIRETDARTNKETIEFRLFNGTINPVIWQNNVNTVARLLLFATREDIREEILRKRIQKNAMKQILSDLESYRELDLEAALEFADLIFDNNLDKINFLRQYRKDCKEKKNTGLVKAKKFTKLR